MRLHHWITFLSRYFPDSVFTVVIGVGYSLYGIMYSCRGESIKNSVFYKSLDRNSKIFIICQLLKHSHIPKQIRNRIVPKRVKKGSKLSTS